MTVKELIEKLNEYDQDLEVYSCGLYGFNRVYDTDLRDEADVRVVIIE